MKKLTYLLLLFFTASALAAQNYAGMKVSANKDSAPVVFQNESVHWISAPNLPDGAKVAYLLGDPRKKQAFIARVKLPAGYYIPVHTHPSDEFDTVISGALYLGMGSKKDTNKGQILTAGSFVMIPAKIPHYEWTKEETILQVSGIGPWDMLEINRNKLVD